MKRCFLGNNGFSLKKKKGIDGVILGERSYDEIDWEDLH